MTPDEETRRKIRTKEGASHRRTVVLQEYRRRRENDRSQSNTLLRWLPLPIPEFRKAYLQARREAVQQDVARLQQATGAAGLTILKLMTDPNVPAAVRLRAAECVFDHAIKGIELEDLDARVTDLELAAGAARAAIPRV